MTTAEISSQKLLFYYSPETSSQKQFHGKSMFWAKPPALSTASEWSLQFDSWEDLCTTILEIPLEENSFVLYRSFVSFVESHIPTLSAVVYNKHPSLGLYFDDIIPIRLPSPEENTHKFRWPSFYREQNAFTLGECLQKNPKDLLNQWTIPLGVRNFAIELAMKNALMESAATEWYPAVRLFQVKLPGRDLVIQECLAFRSREFAMAALKPWFRRDEETGILHEMEVLLINRQTLRVQLEMMVYNPLTSKEEKVYLFVVTR